MRILLAEDDHDMAKGVAALLEKDGLSVPGLMENIAQTCAAPESKDLMPERMIILRSRLTEVNCLHG